MVKPLRLLGIFVLGEAFLLALIYLFLPDTLDVGEWVVAILLPLFLFPLLWHRHRITRNLAAEKERLRITLESIGDAVITTDHAGEIEFMNPVAEKLTGYSQQEASGKDIEKILVLLDETTLVPIESPVKRVLRQLQPVEISNHTLLARRDGHRLSIEDSASPILDSDHNVVGVVIVFRDITLEHEAQLKLEASEQRQRELSERLTTLIEALPDAIFFKDGEGRWLTVNPTGQKLFQLEGVDWQGKTDDELAALQPHMCSMHEICRESDEKAWEKGSSYHNVETVPDISGRNHYFEVSKLPLFNPDNTRRALVIIARDVTDRIEAEESLRKSEERWQFALESSGDGVWDRDITTNKVFFSRRYQEMLGYLPGEIPGQFNEWVKRLHPDDKERVLAAGEKHLKGETEFFREEYRLQCKDGSYKWILARGKVVARDNAGRPLRIIGTQTDITERKKIETELDLAASVFENNSESIMITTAPDNLVLRVNKAFSEITGYSPEEVVGMHPRMLTASKQSEEFYETLWNSVKTTGRWRGELWSRRKNGEVYPGWLVITDIKNSEGVPTHYVSVLADISERKIAEQRIHHLAYYDTLTGLPNRPMLDDHLKHALANAHRNGSRIALLFMDLDNFKTVNDSLGHIAGDLLLASTAERISSCVREGDTVARLGGDEFVVVLPDLTNDEDAMRAAATVAEKVRLLMGAPFDLDGHEVVVTPSIGIAIYPSDADNAVDLIRNADTAMYHAKSRGRNNHQFYAAEMNIAVVERLKMETALRHAIARNELRLFYQPQFTSSGNIIGVEALLRWNSQEFGMVSPAKFIPLAEETGLILPISEWVLNTACVDMLAWQEMGLCRKMQNIAVNISARQFSQADFVSTVKSILERNGLASGHIELELTEGILMLDKESAKHKLDALKSHGFSISVDDFGTGYSSLAYLKHFPIDVLKIDQSFVRDITIDPNDAAITRAIIVMAESLGLTVIAEGVEVEDQLKFLLESGCQMYQGYFFARPMPSDELIALLKKQ